MMNQVKSGKAFEYGMIKEFSHILNCTAQHNSSLTVARDCYNSCNFEEQNKILYSSRKAILFLLSHDSRLTNGLYNVVLQSDTKGIQGDVRDVIVYDVKRSHEIGLSLKNRHSAIKHSRLSETINFGKDWIGICNTNDYKDQIFPIFRELKHRQTRQELWRNIPDKEIRFYVPTLHAFRDELLRLYEIHHSSVASNLLLYLLGRHDFYKIIKENGTISIQSFNMFGSLGWGSKIPLPTRIIEADLKENSNTTLIIICNHGWQISFRIHNASSKIEPSLKFDIQIVGWPVIISRHVIEYMRD